jgi:chitinase
MKRIFLAIFGLSALVLGPVVMITPARAQVNCTGVAAWSPNSVAYAVGNLVTYNGSEYKCLQAHTSQPAWDPVDAASLWSNQGTCSSTTGTTTGTTTGASCTTKPNAPTGLAASGTTSTSTNLSWSAVTPPANCTISSYTIFRNGTSIGTATGTSFSVTGLTASTTYTFTVAATDASGTGAQSSSISVTTSAVTSGGGIQIACGNSAVAPFVADTDFSGGAASSGTTHTIDTSKVTNPAPTSVYQHGRKSTCTYTIPGLTAGGSYTVRLDFCEYAATAAGQRTFNVSINGTQVLTNFDIFAAAGGEFIANAQSFTATANSSGQVVIALTTVVNNVLIAGVEVTPKTTSCTTKPNAPTGLAASGTTSTSTNLSWSAVTAPSGCSISSYTVFKGGTSIGTATGTSFSVTGLSASTTYTFTVAATDAAGTGAQSSSISVTTPSASCTTKPNAPTGLAASGTTSSSTTLNWSAVSAPANCSISGYTVFQGGTAKATVSSGTSFTVTGLSASTTYTFTVAATDAAGTGSQSSSISVTTSVASGGTGKGKVIGYWESWAALPLLTAANNYDVCEVAFAVASGTDGQTQAWPATTESSTQIASDITTLHGQGKKVLISVGGANTFTIKLQNSSDESAFVSSVESMVDTWHLDGLDLDIENNNLGLNAGDTDINNPTTPSTVNMIAAIAALKAHYGSGFMITMAPQVADINCAGHPLGNDGAGLYWGSFIPLINKARANITYVMTQDYNASQMYEKDGVSVVNQGTPDFDVAMSDLLLSGYKIFGTGQAFPAISANQVVVGTPAVAAAAGSGYNTPTAIDQVVNYIKSGTSFGGAYKLSATYPSLGGVMTWDMNYDFNAGDPMSGVIVADVHK